MASIGIRQLPSTLPNCRLIPLREHRYHMLIAISNEVLSRLRTLYVFSIPTSQSKSITAVNFSKLR